MATGFDQAAGTIELGGAIVCANQPSGDDYFLWIDSDTGVFYYYNGDRWVLLTTVWG